MATAGEKQNIRIWKRDNFKCSYCDLDMSSGRNSELIVADHIDPRTKIKTPPRDFGEEHDREKTTACIPCNSFKGQYRSPVNYSRAEKIKAAREHVKIQRKKYSDWFRGESDQDEPSQ